MKRGEGGKIENAGDMVCTYSIGEDAYQQLGIKHFRIQINNEISK